ncbi:MAG: multiheme c-type cytochrome [Acidobacteriota bacterium]
MVHVARLTAGLSALALICLITAASSRAVARPRVVADPPSATQVQAGASPAPNLCLQCHLTNGTARSRAHLLAYQRSAHALNGVGCAECHGGDPAAIDPMRAHLTILGSEDPDSPLNPAKVPETCGRCHAGVLTQFKTSQHYKVLTSTASTTRAPSCVTCHVDGAALLTVDAVGAQCAQCHRTGLPADHAAIPAMARMQMLEYFSAMSLLIEARDFVPLIPDDSLRKGFEAEQARAENGLKLAAEGSHAATYDATEDRLIVALERVLALNRRLMSSLAESTIK